MFKNKKLIAVVLIIAMVLSNVGTSTFAASAAGIVSEYLVKKQEGNDDISYRYHEMFRYEERTTLLMNNGESLEDEEEEEIVENDDETEVEESSTGIEEDTSDFDAEIGEDEEDAGSASVSPYDEVDDVRPQDEEESISQEKEKKGGGYYQETIMKLIQRVRLV